MKVSFYLVIGLIFLFGLTVRIQHAKHGLPYLYDWDEPFIASSAFNLIKSSSYEVTGKELSFGGLVRYSCALQDFIYLQILMLSGTIEGADEVKTNLDGNFRTFSHPEFYFLNRLFMAVISLIGIWFAFQTTLLLTNEKFIAALSIVFMLLFDNYTSYSVIISHEMPYVVFALGAQYFGLCYMKSAKHLNLILSFVFCGLSAASNVIGFASIVVPFFACLRIEKQIGARSRAKAYSLGLLPIFIFLVFNPYVLISFQEYLYWSFSHLKFDLTVAAYWFNQFVSLLTDISFPINAFAILGLLGLLFVTSYNPFPVSWHAKGMILGFPIVVLCVLPFRGEFSINSVLLVYPWVAIWAAFGIYQMCRALQQLHGHAYSVKFMIAMFVLTCAFAFPAVAQDLEYSIDRARARDSRTSAITVLNGIEGDQIVGIPFELQMSDSDLKQLRHRYRLFRTKYLDNALRDCSIVLVPFCQSQEEGFWIYDRVANSICTKLSLFDSLGREAVYLDTVPNLTEVPIHSPKIYFAKGVDYQVARKKSVAEYILHREMAFYKNARRTVGYLDLSAGSSLLEISLEGTPYRGEFPFVRIFLSGRLISSFFYNPDQRVFKKLLVADQPKKLRLEMEFNNDDFDAFEDRNLVVKTVTLTEIDKNALAPSPNDPSPIEAGVESFLQ